MPLRWGARVTAMTVCLDSGRESPPVRLLIVLAKSSFGWCYVCYGVDFAGYVGVSYCWDGAGVC